MTEGARVRGAIISWTRIVDRAPANFGVRCDGRPVVTGPGCCPFDGAS